MLSACLLVQAHVRRAGILHDGGHGTCHLHCSSIKRIEKLHRHDPGDSSSPGLGHWTRDSHFQKKMGAVVYMGHRLSYTGVFFLRLMHSWKKSSISNHCAVYVQHQPCPLPGTLSPLHDSPLGPCGAAWREPVFPGPEDQATTLGNLT